MQLYGNTALKIIEEEFLFTNNPHLRPQSPVLKEKNVFQSALFLMTFALIFIFWLSMGGYLNLKWNHDSDTDLEEELSEILSIDEQESIHSSHYQKQLNLDN
jgi:hypothetical protein